MQSEFNNVDLKAELTVLSFVNKGSVALIVFILLDCSLHGIPHRAIKNYDTAEYKLYLIPVPIGISMQYSSYWEKDWWIFSCLEWILMH